jgi:hypothetical protein
MNFFVIVYNNIRISKKFISRLSGNYLVDR